MVEIIIRNWLNNSNRLLKETQSTQVVLWTVDVARKEDEAVCLGLAPPTKLTHSLDIICASQ